VLECVALQGSSLRIPFLLLVSAQRLTLKYESHVKQIKKNIKLETTTRLIEIEDTKICYFKCNDKEQD
jgi:hypothetical protein